MYYSSEGQKCSPSLGLDDRPGISFKNNAGRSDYSANVLGMFGAVIKDYSSTIVQLSPAA